MLKRKMFYTTLRRINHYPKLYSWTWRITTNASTKRYICVYRTRYQRNLDSTKPHLNRVWTKSKSTQNQYKCWSLYNLIYIVDRSYRTNEWYFSTRRNNHGCAHTRKIDKKQFNIRSHVRGGSAIVTRARYHNDIPWWHAPIQRYHSILHWYSAIFRYTDTLP